MADPSIEIRQLTADEIPLFAEHLARHCAESGQDDDYIFMPYDPPGPDAPKGPDEDKMLLDVTKLGWQRWFAAFDADRIVGHVNLKSDPLATGLHRCELGLGIERSHRGAGLGRELMETAIGFARDTKSIDFVDLKVFGHNTGAKRLYDTLGFIEIGLVKDRFRIRGEKIDDYIMTLDVSRS